MRFHTDLLVRSTVSGSKRYWLSASASAFVLVWCWLHLTSAHTHIQGKSCKFCVLHWWDSRALDYQTVTPWTSIIYSWRFKDEACLQCRLVSYMLLEFLASALVCESMLVHFRALASPVWKCWTWLSLLFTKAEDVVFTEVVYRWMDFSLLVSTSYSSIFTWECLTRVVSEDQECIVNNLLGHSYYLFSLFRVLNRLCGLRFF